MRTSHSVTCDKHFVFGYPKHEIIEFESTIERLQYVIIIWLLHLFGIEEIKISHSTLFYINLLIEGVSSQTRGGSMKYNLLYVEYLLDDDSLPTKRQYLHSSWYQLIWFSVRSWPLPQSPACHGLWVSPKPHIYHLCGRQLSLFDHPVCPKLYLLFKVLCWSSSLHSSNSSQIQHSPALLKYHDSTPKVSANDNRCAFPLVCIAIFQSLYKQVEVPTYLVTVCSYFTQIWAPVYQWNIYPWIITQLQSRSNYQMFYSNLALFFSSNYLMLEPQAKLNSFPFSQQKISELCQCTLSKQHSGLARKLVKAARS